MRLAVPEICFVDPDMLKVQKGWAVSHSNGSSHRKLWLWQLQPYCMLNAARSVLHHNWLLQWSTVTAILVYQNDVVRWLLKAVSQYPKSLSKKLCACLVLSLAVAPQHRNIFCFGSSINVAATQQCWCWWQIAATVVTSSLPVSHCIVSMFHWKCAVYFSTLLHCWHDFTHCLYIKMNCCKCTYQS